MKIISICLHPVYDLVLLSDKFSKDTKNLVLEESIYPAGKGVDVAYYLAHMGNSDNAISGFIGNLNDETFIQFFDKHNIKNLMIPVDGRIRTNIRVETKKNHTDNNNPVTDINTIGSLETANHIDGLKNTIERLSKIYDLFIFSGSLPFDAPDDLYKDLIEIVHKQNKIAYLDTSENALIQGVKANPDFIKPNIHEYSQLIGRPVNGKDDVINTIQQYHKGGIGKVCVSMDKDGFILCDETGIYKSTPPQISVRSAVGAGDALVAGFALAQSRGMNTIEAIKLATAMSCGACMESGPRLPHIDVINDIMKDIEVNIIN